MKTRAPVRCVGVLAVVGGLLACGGGGDGDRADASPADQASEVGRLIAEGYCTQLFECCDATELADELGFFDPDPTSAEECIAILAGLSAREVSNLLVAEEEGRVALDLSGAAACGAALAAAACDAWYVDGDPFVAMVAEPACAALVVPLGEVGATCAADRECASTRCDLVDRTCAAASDLGGPCENVYDCAEHLDCLREPGADEGSCVERSPEGESCTYENQCRSDHCVGSPAVCTLRCDGL